MAAFFLTGFDAMDEPGRNADGTFADGNTFSDGRNKYLRQQELKELFAAAVTDSEIQRLANKLMAMSLDGDLQAAKLLLHHVFKDQQAPAVAVQINQTSNDAERRQKTLALLEKVTRAGRLRAAGVHDHRVADVIEVQAKRRTCEDG